MVVEVDSSGGGSDCSGTGGVREGIKKNGKGC